jgi:hypothetical protein
MIRRWCWRWPGVPDAANKTSGGPTERTPAQNQTVGNVFVISPDKKIKLMLVYPMATGWNFNEVLRAIDSLQLTARPRHRVATPVNWSACPAQANTRRRSRVCGDVWVPRTVARPLTRGIQDQRSDLAITVLSPRSMIFRRGSWHAQLVARRWTYARGVRGRRCGRPVGPGAMFTTRTLSAKKPQCGMK